MNEQDFVPVFDAHCDTATRIFTDGASIWGRGMKGGILISRA